MSWLLVTVSIFLQYINFNNWHCAGVCTVFFCFFRWGHKTHATSYVPIAILLIWLIFRHPLSSRQLRLSHSDSKFKFCVLIWRRQTFQWLNTGCPHGILVQNRNIILVIHRYVQTPDRTGSDSITGSDPILTIILIFFLSSCYF